MLLIKHIYLFLYVWRKWKILWGLMCKKLFLLTEAEKFVCRIADSGRTKWHRKKINDQCAFHIPTKIPEMIWTVKRYEWDKSQAGMVREIIALQTVSRETGMSILSWRTCCQIIHLVSYENKKWEIESISRSPNAQRGLLKWVGRMWWRVERQDNFPCNDHHYTDLARGKMRAFQKKKKIPLGCRKRRIIDIIDGGDDSIMLRSKTITSSTG